MIDFEFNPEDVMDYVKSGAQSGLNNLTADLKELCKELDECQDVFHGSSRSGTNSGIKALYDNFSKLIGHASGHQCSGCWGTAYAIRTLLNESYRVAKVYQETQEELAESMRYLNGV